MGRHSARWHRKPGWVRLLDYLDLQIPTSPIRYLGAAVFGLLFTEAVSILASIINQP